MSTDLSQSTGITNPLTLAQAIIDKGGDPEQLGAVLALAEKWEANRAREAYARAMNSCQQEMPIVLEDSENTHTRSKYASLTAVNSVIKPCYTRHGFSVQFSESEAKVPEEIRIIADVMHDQGHERRYYVDLARDGTGIKGNSNMTPLQGKGSTFSYGQRYLLKMIFNLTIAGEDIDGNYGQGLSDDETAELNDLIEKCRSYGRTEASVQGFWDWIFVEKGTKKRMADMNARDFPRAKEDMLKWLKKFAKDKTTK